MTERRPSARTQSLKLAAMTLALAGVLLGSSQTEALSASTEQVLGETSSANSLSLERTDQHAKASGLKQWLIIPSSYIEDFIDALGQSAREHALEVQAAAEAEALNQRRHDYRQSVEEVQVAARARQEEQQRQLEAQRVAEEEEQQRQLEAQRVAKEEEQQKQRLRGPQPFDYTKYQTTGVLARDVMNDLGCGASGLQWFNTATNDVSGYIVYQPVMRSGVAQTLVWNTVYLNQDRPASDIARVAAHECLHLRQMELYGDVDAIHRQLSPAYGTKTIYGIKDVRHAAMEIQVDCATYALGYPTTNNTYAQNCPESPHPKTVELLEFARSTELAPGDFYR